MQQIENDLWFADGRHPTAGRANSRGPGGVVNYLNRDLAGVNRVLPAPSAAGGTSAVVPAPSAQFTEAAPPADGFGCPTSGGGSNRSAVGNGTTAPAFSFFLLGFMFGATPHFPAAHLLPAVHPPAASLQFNPGAMPAWQQAPPAPAAESAIERMIGGLSRIIAETTQAQLKMQSEQTEAMKSIAQSHGKAQQATEDFRKPGKAK